MATFFENVLTSTGEAGAALSRRRFVKYSTDGQLIQAAAGGDDAIGVSLEAAAAAGDTFAVAMYNGGIVEMDAGAAIDVTAGAVPVKTDATGRAVGGVGATDRILGYAVSSAAAADEVVSVRLTKGASHSGA